FSLGTVILCFFFFFQAEDGIRDRNVTGVQTCALPISVLLVASNHAAFAADAFGHIEVKPILLSGQDSTLRDGRYLRERCPALWCATGTRPGLGGQQEVRTLFFCFL